MRVCEAFVAEVVFQVMEYGAVVSSVPRLVPSRRNWTLETPVLSEAVTERVTVVPETVEPEVGVVREMVGAVVSGVGRVVALAFVACAEAFPAASYAETVYEYRVEGLRVVSKYVVPVGLARSTPARYTR